MLTFPAGVEGWTQDEWTSQWDERRIRVRGDWLVQRAVRAWPRRGPVPPKVIGKFDSGSRLRDTGPATEPGSTAPTRTRVVHDVQGDLLPLVRRGLVVPGDRLRHVKARTGEAFEAHVTDDGGLRTRQGLFEAPSTALSRLVGSSRNGWTDWTHVQTGKSLAELRSMIREYE